MKLWELVSIMREEKSLLMQSLPPVQSEWAFISDWMAQFDDLVKTQDREKLDYELPVQFVRSVLTKSKLTYYLSQDGYLGLANSLKADQALSALEIFARYGGNLMEEVGEKGSAQVL